MFSSSPCHTIRPFCQIITKPPPRVGGFGGAGSKLRQPNSAVVAEKTAVVLLPISTWSQLPVGRFTRLRERPRRKFS